MGVTKKTKQKRAIELMLSFGYDKEDNFGGCDGCFIKGTEYERSICKELSCKGLIWKDPNNNGVDAIQCYVHIKEFHE